MNTPLLATFLYLNSSLWLPMWPQPELGAPSSQLNPPPRYKSDQDPALSIARTSGRRQYSSYSPLLRALICLRLRLGLRLILEL